jgi:thiol-disulfide isomerase/thioredoxin
MSLKSEFEFESDESWVWADFNVMLVCSDILDLIVVLIVVLNDVFHRCRCPPCRGFTPILAEFYEQLKGEDGHEDALEIIFVSSDENLPSFNDYYKKMPWTAMQFEQRGLKNSLSQVLGVRGIPTFVILTAKEGLVKDKNGRATVSASKGNTVKVLKQWEAEVGAPMGGAAEEPSFGCTIQ